MLNQEMYPKVGALGMNFLQISVQITSVAGGFVFYASVRFTSPFTDLADA